MTRDPRLRASDADRERVADLLRQHCGEGRLTMEEFQHRLDACFAARTYGELDALVQDLPGPGPYDDLPVPASRTGGASPTLPYMTPPSTEIAPWRGAASTYLSVNLVCWLVWLLTGMGYPWPVWVTGPWGVILVGRVVGGQTPRDRHRPDRRR